MSFLYDNVAAIMVAIAASAVVWTFGGTRGDLLPYFVPWLVVFMIEVLICFPQAHHDESSYEARERVWKALRRDPVMWISLGLLVLLAIPFVNNGLCPVCDAAAIAAGKDPDPPVPILPFCVNRLEHLNVFLWFALALTAMVVVRHALTRRGKRTVIELIMWNGAAVAALGFLQGALDAPGPLWDVAHSGLLNAQKPGDFFATFGYPNMAGDYFVTLFGIAVALWRDHLAHIREERKTKSSSTDKWMRSRMFWRKHYFLIPAAVFFFAALNTLSRAAIILVTTTGCVYFVHALVSFLARMHRSKRASAAAWSLGIFGLLVFFATLFMPDDIQKEVDTLGTTEVLDRVTGRGQYHVRVATELWKDHWLFGCGGWGYLHFCASKMTPEELKNMQMVGGVNVHNDYIQFLAEHGLVGFGAMVAIVVLLLVPVGRGWHKLAYELRFKNRNELPPKPALIFVMPASAFCILVTAIATFIHSFGDCAMRSPTVLMLFFVSLAAMPGFLPKDAE